MNGEVSFAEPDIQDAELVWRWRTDPRTLRHWFNPRAFSLESHRAWMRRVLDDPDDHLLLGRVAGRNVGVLRLSTAVWKGERYGEAGIYLDPELHGRGLGARLLERFPDWSRARVPALRGLFARVDQDNAASRRIFEKAGFRLLAARLWGGLPAAELVATLAALVRENRAPDSGGRPDSELRYVGFFLDLPG